MQKVPQHKLLASVEVKRSETQQESAWWAQNTNQDLQMGKENYNLELVVDFYTK